MQKFLAEINQDLDADKWQVTCHLFAPYAPEEKTLYEKHAANYTAMITLACILLWL
jgi:hypothetical protein